ncbi:uncharacterized protein [Panulirus ornatus]
MIRERAAMLVLWMLMGLFQAGATQQAHAITKCSDGSGSCGSGVAQSQSVDANGVTTGECAYTDPRGQTIKVLYREEPGGRVEARANSPSVTNAVEELRRCRQAASVVSENVQQNVLQTQEQILREQQQLQQEILRQQQELFDGNFPFSFPNPIPVYNFGHGRFG